MVVLKSCSHAVSASFPTDFLSIEQKQNGGLIVHFLLAIYSCCALVHVCETYFVPSLQIISKRLKLSNDVAGATFMAAGGASPGLFTSILGTFITNDDLGLGTIMGSASFDTFAMIGICAMFSKTAVTLEWWPTTRDFFFYIICVGVLIIVINDTVIRWWESMLMVFLFAAYIVLLVNNQRIKDFYKFIGKKFLKRISKETSREDALQEQFGKDNVMPTARIKRIYSLTPTTLPITLTSPNGEFAPPGSLNATEIAVDTKDNEEDQDSNVPWPWIRSSNSCCGIFWWLAMMPLSILYFVTIPDCRKRKWENFFALSFIVSIIYIGLLTFFLSWMIDTIGRALFIPDTVMGVTFLAIGTGLPDLCCSIVVYRQGFPTMAIANGFGSNIMDILINLGLMWFIKAVFLSKRGSTHTNSNSFAYTSTYVIVVLIFLYVGIAVNRFRLDRKVAIVAFVFYVAFLVIAVVLELNLFGVSAVALVKEAC